MIDLSVYSRSQHSCGSGELLSFICCLTILMCWLGKTRPSMSAKRPQKVCLQFSENLPWQIFVAVWQTLRGKSYLICLTQNVGHRTQDLAGGGVALVPVLCALRRQFYVAFLGPGSFTMTKTNLLNNWDSLQE